MNVWLLTDGEPFFFEEGNSCHRVGSLAKELAEEGHRVIWWTSKLDHNSKTYNTQYGEKRRLSELLKVNFLSSSGYKRNMSLARILHARAISKEFHKRSKNESTPDIVVASMPSPEFCLAGYLYSKEMNIPFVADIRDPWPDIFSGYFPKYLSFFLSPLIYYYRRMIRIIAQGSSGMIAVSRSQLDWGLSYSGRDYDDKKDKLLYIGYENKTRSQEIKTVEKFSDTHPMNCIYITSWGSSYDAYTLIEAAKILQKEVGQAIQIIATGDGESRTSRMESAKNLRNIKFTGFISSEEMDKFLNSAHVGLVVMKGGITKYWVGNKIGEYIASSLGMVNNVETEVSNIIDENSIGINVPSEDPEAVAKAIIYFFNNPHELRKSMVNSRNLFAKSFDRIQNSKSYVSYLEGICSKT